MNFLYSMQPRFVSSLASLSWYASFSLKHCISPLTFYLILIFPVIIKITIYYKKNFIPLIIANSQKLPRRFYETKKSAYFFLRCRDIIMKKQSSTHIIGGINMINHLQDTITLNNGYKCLVWV